YIGRTLESIRSLNTSREYELIVVDGGSEDGTRDIAREYGATVYDQPEEIRGSIGLGRDYGARKSEGDWLAFVDADTAVYPNHLDEMLEFAESNGLVAATSRCRMTDVWRAKLMQATLNQIFSRMRRPVLPGFNFFVERQTYFGAGGFPDVPNEDTAFSLKLANYGDTAYHSEVLVESSGRRIAELGLTGTLIHYVLLDIGRYWAEY
ncbi:MAG: glycosyltransferase, partial [Halobacteria archaeon]|nr:glycosyltransferase [Halobacteria archaeon]